MQDEALPTPPAEAQDLGSATLPAGFFDQQDVPTLGEAIPKGTYHFRAEGFSILERPVDGYEGADQPTFMIRWVCQEEAAMGRSFTDFVDYVEEGLIEDATNGHPKAATIIRQRLPRVKSIIESCGKNPNAGISFKAFLEENPECRITVSVRPRKSRDADGKLVPTGEMQNSAVKYISLTVPVG